MTEKEKAIEDETIEVSAESTEKKTKKPHRRRAIVITVVVLALLTAVPTRPSPAPPTPSTTASWPRPGRIARPHPNACAPRRTTGTRF